MDIFDRKLTVIEALLNKANSQQFRFPKNIKIVAVQHLMAQTVHLFKAMIDLGVDPDSIYVVGKTYSNNSESIDALKKLGVHVIASSEPRVGEFYQAFCNDVDQLWKEVKTSLPDNSKTQIIILDDGGWALAKAPVEITRQHPIVGIEQTRSGTLHPSYAALPFPVIEAATSAAKKKFESPLIAKKALEELLPAGITGQQCAVIGTGAIGMALANYLKATGNTVSSYDICTFAEPRDHMSCGNLQDAIKNADYIFGTTGTDIFKDCVQSTQFKNGAKLVSLSSGDIEFQSIMRHMGDPILRDDNLTGIVQSSRVNVMKKGYPINFDGSPESVPLEKIQITLGLLLAASLEAASMVENPTLKNVPQKIMLSPAAQKWVLSKSLPTMDPMLYSATMKIDAGKLDWLAHHSGGIELPSSFFAEKTPTRHSP